MEPPEHTEKEVEICREVCSRFVQNRESTSHRFLLTKFTNLRVLQELEREFGFLQGTGGHLGRPESYVPRLSAFVLAGNEENLRLIRFGMVLAIKSLIALFLDERFEQKAGVRFEDIVNRAKRIDANISEKALQLGIWMVCGTGAFAAYMPNDQTVPIEKVYIYDHIVSVHDDPEGWVDGQIAQARGAVAARKKPSFLLQLNPTTNVVGTGQQSSLTDNIGTESDCESDVCANAMKALAFMHHDLQDYAHYFNEEKLTDAVAAAFRRVENRLNEIRDNSVGLSKPAKGVGLPYALFESGDLKFPFPRLGAMDEQARSAYKQALMNLLAAGIGWFRNSFDHEPHNIPELDDGQALECLFVASYMLRILDMCVQDLADLP